MKATKPSQMPINFSIALRGYAFSMDSTMDMPAQHPFHSLLYLEIWYVLHHPIAIRCYLLGMMMCKQIIENGMELGAADDAVFGSINNKRLGGVVGHLSCGVMDREEYYTHAVTLACVPFQNVHMYFDA